MKQRKLGLRGYVTGVKSTVGFTREGKKPSRVVDNTEFGVERLQFRGGNHKNVGAHDSSRLYPRVAEGDYCDMLYVTDVVHTAEIDMLLVKFCSRNSTAWKNYTALHTARRTQREDGFGDYHVVKEVQPKFAPPDELVWSKRKSNSKIKRYTLAQIFCDSYLQDKYQLSAKFRRDVQAVAISRPADAAATLQDALNAKSSIPIEVSAGGYAETRQQAAATIRNLSYGKPMPQADIEGSVIGKELFMWGPNGFNKDWFVQGPLKNAEQVSDVYRLASFCGLQETMFLLSNETQFLGIEICDGEHYISPYVIGHVKNQGQDLPPESHPDTLSRMTDVAKVRMEELSVNVRPVDGEDGLLASAVQIHHDMLLINNHVKEVDEATSVGGSSLAGGTPVSHDLWMQNIVGDYQPWSIRSAQVGERVAIFYHNGTKPVMSAPFVIDRITGLHICSKKNGEIVAGMSGGALVSLDDFSLLGMHCGTNLRHLLAISYTETLQWDLVELMRDADRARQDSRESADSVLVQLKSRGNHKHFIEALDRMVPLFDLAGGHVGSAVQLNDSCVTTCPAAVYESDSGVLDFATATGFHSRCSLEIPAGPLPVVRGPQLHERVVVVGVNRDGHYMSHETLVRQVGAGGRTFMLSATERNVFPLVGGLVMSVQDGASLGMYIRDSTNASLGKLSLCTTFPVADKVVVQPAVELQRALPMLSTAVWDMDMLAEAVRHPSACQSGLEVRRSHQGLALLGDVWLKAKLYEALDKARVPAREWTDYFKELQNNDVLASLCANLGLSELLETQPGLRFKAGSKAYADMMEALIAVMFKHEEPGTMDVVLSVLGLVPEPSECKGATAPYGHMMRRPSEIALKTYSLNGEVQNLSPID